MKIWPFSSPAQRITTYERCPQGVERVAFEKLATQDQLQLSMAPVTSDQLQGKLKQLKSDQAAGTSVSPPVGRDVTVNPGTVLMGYDSQDPVSLDYIAQVALVGKVEGFSVVAAARPEEMGKAQRKLSSQAADNTTWLANPGGHDSWVEDHGEFSQAGEVVIPAILPADSDDIEDWVIRGRRDRYNVMAEQGQPRPRADYAMLGLVNRRQAQEEMVTSALASGASQVKMAVSYVEGGNMLPGQRADGSPFALVGKDSLAVTGRLLPKGADEAAARAQVAKDYGLQPEQVVAVEQPGDFHIDMAMSLAGPGQVMLNDSRKVLDLQKGWLNQHYANSWLHKDELPGELEAVQKRAERQAVYEDVAEKELRAAGLEVFRVAGCFPKTGANPEMNFLNLRQGTNEQGEIFAIALGGEERAEKAFAETLLGEIPSGYHRIHFLDRKLTAETLKFKGGIKCRTKIRL